MVDLCSVQGCQSGDCHERKVLKAREGERLKFLKFEGAYGNQKAPYVEDEFQPGLMEKNPYAPGGAKARQNELLKKRGAAGGEDDLCIVLPPDAAALVTVVNFSVTRSGLQSQLLGATIQHEQPEMEKQKIELLQKEEALKVQLCVSLVRRDRILLSGLL